MFSSKNQFLTGAGGYQISRSVRLRSSASAYFNRTPASAGSRTTWTMSLWVKRGALGVRQFITMSGVNPNSSQVWQVEFDANNKLDFYNQTIGTYRRTTQVFRDVGAWYHIVFGADTNNATAQNRFRCWVNGVEITAWDVNSTISSGYTFAYNGAYLHGIGAYTYSGNSLPLDGYLTEIHFIDGQALTPSSFGETNAITGVWQPEKYTGTYGTNGFYLNFSDNSGATATTIGKDYSGNGNNWTPNNISVTAGVTYDSMLDVPTQWADGGNGRGNYPVWNPLTSGGLVTFTEANLKALSTSASVPYNIESTIKTATTGKWYAEVTMAVGASSPAVGIGNNPSASSSNTDQFTAYRVNGTYITSGMGASSTGTPATFTTNDVIGIAYDVGAGTLSFYKNGTLQTGGFTGITAGNYSFIVRKDSASGDGGYLNCGQRPFTYTPPTGFVALNTQNLPTPTISNGANYMAATTYTGTAGSQSISNAVNGISFQPSLVWVKTRSAVTSHEVYDAVRGVGIRLETNNTNVENNLTVNGLLSFNANGFTVPSTSNFGINGSGYTYVGWQWNAGGSTVTNTSGTISAQVRANATAGFSVVTYTGTGANATVGHGLGVAPSMVIIKNRTDGTRNWQVYHAYQAASPANGSMSLNLTNAYSADSTVFNNTVPTSTVFSVGTLAASNGSTNSMVAYCFAAVAGYSAFGRYTGNGSADGPFVFLGFRPRYILIKRTDTVGNWNDFDTSRNTYNGMNNLLLLNTADAEVAGGVVVDSVSNGFKLRDSSANWNASGGTYIYAAFAENPFKISLAR